MNDALAETIDNGYFEVSASRRIWRGVWGRERCVWCFPSQQAADDFVASGALKTDGVNEPFDTPLVTFVKWDGVENKPAASEPGAAGKALAIIEHRQSQGKSRHEIASELASIGLGSVGEDLSYSQRDAHEPSDEQLEALFRQHIGPTWAFTKPMLDYARAIVALTREQAPTTDNRRKTAC